MTSSMLQACPVAIETKDSCAGAEPQGNSRWLFATDSPHVALELSVNGVALLKIVVKHPLQPETVTFSASETLEQE